MNQAKRQSRKLGWRFVVFAVVVIFVFLALLRNVWMDVYFIPSESMEPLLLSGDRVLVSRTSFAGRPIERGDVVVFDGRGSFTPLKCCTDGGLLEINGVPVSESYLYPGDEPSALNFEVTVPQGKLWLMGDHRNVSLDSRSLLGAPGGGLISTTKVIGSPIATVWPLGRLHVIDSDTRLP